MRVVGTVKFLIDIQMNLLALFSLGIVSIPK